MVYDWFTRSAAPENGETPELDDAAAVSAEAVEAPAAAPPAVEPGVDQDALEWARQAYARLKAQQEAEKLQQEAPEAAPEPPAVLSPEAVQPVQAAETAPAQAPAAGPSLLEQAAAQRAQRQQELLERAIDTPPEPAPTPAASSDEAAPQLGAFDDDFTWSAEVLAAQGRQLDQISLEEIDWLGRLRRGMEKTRQGFVTQLLDNLGDDPLTPEVLDDLETLLLRADVGVTATDQVLDALRRPRLLEVAPEEPDRLIDALEPGMRFEWFAARQPFRRLGIAQRRLWLERITAVAEPGARGRWLFSRSQLGPAGSLLAALAGGRQVQIPDSARRLLEATRPLEQAWLGGVAGHDAEGGNLDVALRLELEQLGWQVSEDSWEETLELRLDSALLQRWFAVGATYRRQLEEALDPQVAAQLEGLFRGQLGLALPQPIGHRLLHSRLEQPQTPPWIPQGRSRSIRQRSRQDRRSPTP